MANAIYCRNGHFNGLVPERDLSLIHAGAYHDWQEKQIREKLARLAFCPQCGAENLRGCLHCGTKTICPAEYASERPSYCCACGTPFSWTEIALATAREYTDELEQLSAEDKAALKATFADLTTDTPRTGLAASRFVKIISKISAPLGEMLKKIIVDVVTEAVKKAWGA
jgi:hypothetical protein